VYQGTIATFSESVRGQWSAKVEEYNEHRSELNADYIKDNTNLLKRDFNLVMKKQLDNITIDDIIACFTGMEKRGLKTTPKKAGSLVNRLFRYAVTKRYTVNNPMTSIDLTVLLKKHKPTNFAHITDENVFKQLLHSIQEYTGDIYTRSALRFMPYAFVRPANIRGMLWAEVDFEKRLWTIPGSKMKMDRDHVVPLTDSMIDILDEVNDGRSKYVFPSPQTSLNPMSDNTLNVGLKRMGFAGVMTSHGFRHTASTILHENISVHGLPSEVIEIQLSHVEKNAVKGVYNKALYMTERRALMEWWSNYVDKLLSTPL